MICRRCGEKISDRRHMEDNVLICPNCGARYRRKINPQANLSKRAPVARCASCGAPLKEGADFCHICGMPRKKQKAAGITPAPTPQKAGKQPQRKKHGWIIGLLIGLLVLDAALAFGVFLFLGRTYNVSFDLGYNTLETAPDSQIVKKGDCAVEPEAPVRDGYTFLGWYSQKQISRQYDFKQPVTSDLSLTAKWFDPNDARDSDGDGLPDVLEATIGTDASNPDTDGDGLSDYIEFKVLGLDPLSKDTGNSGTPDGQKDSDSDGLPNLEEVNRGTNPLLPDSDHDGLTDYEETAVYGTSPVDRDTDHDKADDKTEIQIGSDPLKPDSSFTTSASAEPISSINPISISVTAETDGSGADTLRIEPLTSTYIPALSAASRGYLGTAYEIHADGTLNKATLSFSYDPALGTIGDAFMPCIYYYDEAENELVELGGQVAVNGTVTAEITHFSAYALLNKVLVDLANTIAGGQAGASLPDSNNDGIADYYIDLINDGKLLYDNTDMLVGILDMFGTDNDDWDGDGLKNGEEIFIITTAAGGAKIKIKSNPILRDSDFDEISDFVEIRQLHTNPLRYDRKSVGALDKLQEDAYYYYASREKGFGEGFVEFFDFQKYDKAKSCLIDYFYDYAPEETIAKNAELIEQRAAHEEFLKIYNAVSSVVKVARDINGAWDTGLANAQLENTYYESIDLRKNLLSDMQMEKVRLDHASKQLSLLRLPQTVQGIIEDLSSGSAYQMIDSSAAIISTASNALSIYHNACQYHIFSLAKEFGDRGKCAEALTPAAQIPSATGTLFVICDIVEAGGNLMEITNTYSKLRANADAYNMFTELLLYIRDNASADYIGDAADDVAKIVLDDSSSEYYRQLSEACGKELSFAAFKTALDVAAKHNAYASLAKLLMKLYDMTGVSNLAKFNAYFDVMAEISKGCNALLDRAIIEESQTFSYSAEDGPWVEKYLVQLAQSRIIGEYYFYEYCADQSGAGWVLSLFSGVKPEEYREMFKPVAEKIYGYANRLKLRLSKNLPYYSSYWSDSAPEDELEGVADVVNLNGEWNEAYRQFVMNQEYVGTKDYSNASSTPQDAFYPEDTVWYPIRFGLYDMNRDGVPELIIYNGADFMAGAFENVFSYSDMSVHHVGIIGRRDCQLYYFESEDYPGLFITDGNMGKYQTDYYTLINSQINPEEVCIHDTTSQTWDDSTMTWVGDEEIIRVTTDDELYNLEINGEHHDFKQFTLAEIRVMGWEAFVNYYFSSNRDIVSASINNLNPIEMNSDQQYAANIFLSNFAEQGFNHFSISSPDIDQLVDFAFLFCKINRRNEAIGVFQTNNTSTGNTEYYYTVSLDNVNETLERHFGIQLDEASASRFPTRGNPQKHYWNGTFYFPAADGEAYNELAIAKKVYPMADGTFCVSFNVYSLKPEEYRMSGIDWNYYSMTADKARFSDKLTFEQSGVAIVKPYNYYGKQTFQLIEYSAR